MLAQLPPPLPTYVYSDDRLRQKSAFIYVDGSRLQEQREDIKNRVKLNDDFLLVMKDYPADDSIKEKIAAELVSFLIITKSTNITFEKTPEDSFLVKSKVNNTDYFVAIYFDEEIQSGYECFLNMYNGKKPIGAFEGDLEKVFLKLIDSQYI
jgi:hypothetical protein